MKLILESDNLDIVDIPDSPQGNYWIKDGTRNVLNVESKDNNWVIKSNQDVNIYKNIFDNSKREQEVILKNYDYYYLAENTHNKGFSRLFILPSYEIMDNIVVDFNKVNQLVIGKNDNSDIVIENDLFEEKQLIIEKVNSTLKIKNLNNMIKLFINDNLTDEKILSSGDIIFIAGIYIYYFDNLLCVSNYNNLNNYNSNIIQKRLIKENEIIDYSNYEEKEIKIYDKSDCFRRPPRFKKIIENKVFVIDPPTQKESQEEMPLIFTIAPMLTMGTMSLLTGITSLQKVLDGKSTLKDELMSLIMCGTMMFAMIIFPLIQKFYIKIKKKQREKKRVKKYKEYIKQKRDEIFEEINYQKKTLLEEYMSNIELCKMINTENRNLWERKIEHDDFLSLRLGIGTKKPMIEIKYPQEHFTLEEDDLKQTINDLVNESKDINDVPITLNFKTHNKVGIICNNKKMNQYISNLMLQIIANQGYDSLRIVVFTNENDYYWEQFKNLPYFWNNESSIRYYASTNDEINTITTILKEEYNYRLEVNDNKTNFNPYYLFITDDLNVINNNVLLKDILKSQVNLGYSVIMCVPEIDLLPNECNVFVDIKDNESSIFTDNMSKDSKINFNADYIDFDLKPYITKISSIPMDINNGKFVLPKKLGFLEMYDVGNVKQLNILNRWKNNDIINSLSCPVGLDENGELFKIDLHEKAHGPHGLVAGMTGSGKSEWIITYILSMAINYSPEEVQFVLIDYKGGGLALTFDNRETGVKLPHVVGTITNLDIVEINRSLASIESELKRRQTMFKEAREELNESSMDIYKYQELYRNGKVKEPMSHLFIISDEFAELKAQQPEFMDELISTARIGRSLGVHLILATQKPSGVVDDQIWSNSKFRICLKVQDKHDSNDMIKCPDGALLKETGRFYLQVGYNEFFAKGQCAYAGVPYYESDNKIKIVDTSIDFIDNTGAIIKKGNIERNNIQYVHKGEELPNLIEYIINESNNEKLNVKPLWLGSIPKNIYVDKLKQKYNWEKKDLDLDLIIGEYDYPSKQKQDLLTLPISRDGNVLIFGASGNGKENLLTTILYSMIKYYSVYEVNSYILDFGSEVLNNFENASHIGDIIHSGEDEKIQNLFKFINTEMNRRRKLFIKHNGNYTDYVKNTGDKIPNIVIIINQFEIFNDLYEMYVDKLSELTRDANRYGIYFIITSSSTMGVKTKISQNFKNILCLQLNDELDYRNILGNTNGILPSKMFGRGLIKLDKVVEFQTALAFEKETLYDNIKSFCIDIFMQYKIKAKPIPVLPEIISFKDINKKNITVSNIPIGLIKQSLEVANIDIDEQVAYLINSRSFEDIIPFLDKLLMVLNNTDTFNTFVFDTKFIYETNNYQKINYLNKNFIDILNKINDYTNQVNDVLNKNDGNKKSITSIKDIVCVIIGVDKFISGLDDDKKAVFENIIANSKENLKIHFLLVDTPNSLKKYEYDDWYKNSIDSTNGIWVGDGFTEQYSIKPAKIIQQYYESIGTKYGYLVENGNVEFIKFVEKE